MTCICASAHCSNLGLCHSITHLKSLFGSGQCERNSQQKRSNSNSSHYMSPSLQVVQVQACSAAENALTVDSIGALAEGFSVALGRMWWSLQRCFVILATPARIEGVLKGTDGHKAVSFVASPVLWLRAAEHTLRNLGCTEKLSRFAQY